MIPETKAALDAVDRAIAEIPPEDLPLLFAALSARLTTASARLLTCPPRLVQADGEIDGNISVPDAARRLGVSPAWLYKHARHLPFALRIGRRLLFSSRGLERWNAQRQGR